MRILHWFRKDLRLDDNPALCEAASDAAGEVAPFYTSEPAILGRDDIAPIRVRFVLDALADLDANLRARGSALALAHGDATTTVLAAARAAHVDAVYWNDEYEPLLRARDTAVENALESAGIRVKRFHDRLIVPPGAVATQADTPFTVYTPFRKACEALPISGPHPAPTRLASQPLPSRPLATLDRLGFTNAPALPWPAGESAARARLTSFVAGEGLSTYATRRDEPAAPATSRLSADFKFGTLGIRRAIAMVQAAAGESAGLGEHATKFLQELRWRDFYAHVLWHFPHVEHGAFRPDYDRIAWQGTDAHFAAWCTGHTGYPIVDAGMRQLLATGTMHNRVRMIVASFLTKDLLIDWRRGERHFMQHLLDGDLASNNGGWQWSAGTGTDAAPYFRIFNPTTQSRRFDSEGQYIKQWLPELAALSPAEIHTPGTAQPLPLAAAGVVLGETYPFQIVDHTTHRERALAMYGEIKNNSIE